MTAPTPKNEGSHAGAEQIDLDRLRREDRLASFKAWLRFTVSVGIGCWAVLSDVGWFACLWIATLSFSTLASERLVYWTKRRQMIEEARGDGRW